MLTSDNRQKSKLYMMEKIKSIVSTGDMMDAKLFSQALIKFLSGLIIIALLLFIPAKL